VNLRAASGLLASALLTAVTGAAAADEPGPIVTLQAENDFFVSNDDGQYSHGMQASYLSGANDVPDLVIEAADWIPGYHVGADMRWGLAIAQSMFTPDDIRSTNLLVDDRPYAGWLRADIGLVSVNQNWLDRASLSLGIVGPQSYAEETQVWFHEVIAAPRPNGWDHQLSNEPAINLFYEKQCRSDPIDLSALGLQWDYAPRATLALGNVFTYGGVGGEVRLGQDLQDDYGAPRIGPGIAGTGYFLPGDWDDLGWYLFAGVEGRAVAHNIFLDGNTFADSHSVSRRVFVSELQTGAAVTWGHIRLTFTHILRTKQFDGQDDPDQFGAISLSTTL
tara:strand:+ start:2419 stop:3420 length:1002 start_codon:yes stop_codon:yes gene_type:complete